PEKRCRPSFDPRIELSRSARNRVTRVLASIPRELNSGEFNANRLQTLLGHDQTSAALAAFATANDDGLLHRAARRSDPIFQTNDRELHTNTPLEKKKDCESNVG